MHKQILLIDHRPVTRQNTLFLLRLARYRTTPVCDLDEALHWLSNRRDLADPFDLVLLNNPLPGMTPAQAGTILQKMEPALPLLWVKRDAAASLPPEGHLLRHCHPEDILHTLQALC